MSDTIYWFFRSRLFITCSGCKVGEETNVLRVYQSSSAGQAKDYFSKELSQGDYYTDGQEIAGRWGGKAAKMLGLSGTVEQEAFNSLVDNIHPSGSDNAGERLTAHNKGNRRPGYDLTFNAPKALSVLYEYSKDEKLLDAFRDSVHKTMESIEEEMHARVRKDGLNEDRKTGNLVYGEFVHFTARPVDNMAPDPQLHAHCFVMNATHDSIEDQWKAGQFGNIKRDAPYFEAMFHSHLAKSLSDIGLNIERDGKFWTIEEIDKSTLDKFSNRTAQIEEVALKKGITTAKGKDALGQKLRGQKVGGLTRDTLRENWWDRLDSDERATLDSLLNDDGNDPEPSHLDVSHLIKPSLTADQCLDYAVKHHIERQSVVPLTRLKETALRYGVGQITPEELNQAVNNHKELITVERDGREMATTEHVLLEEKVIIQFTKNGYASQDKLNDNYEIGMVTDHKTQLAGGTQFELSKEQKEVVSNLLQSRDRVMALQGKAGTGKTTTLATLIDGIEQGGGSAMCLAPTADAAYDTLKKDGEAYKSEAMQNAHTLARYFVDEKLWEQSKGSVLLVDEAGLMSVDDMHTLYSLAHAHDSRIVLIGDTAQHNSVNRGDAYRILQEEAYLEPLVLENIRRQKGEYKEAVSAISKGKILKGYDKLDELQAITQESDDDLRYQMLSKKYADIVDKGRSVLAVSPTHAEGKKVTNAIRDTLKERGHIKGDEQLVTRYKNLHFTEAERSDIHNYREGQLVRFQQNATPTSGKSIKRGEQFTVSHTDKEDVWLKDSNGREMALNISEPLRFNIYERQDIALSKGEKIRITEGGKSKDGKRLNNGAIYQVKEVNKEGDIVLDNGRVLDHKKGNYDYGYVTTSHSSQGKTVDHVLIAQSSDYGGAASSEQFYVSVSRGKKSVEIFTDDKDELRTQIQNSHQRISATELIRNESDFDAHNHMAAMKHYAKYTMGHLAGTEKDYLQEFRDPPSPSNDTNKWQEHVRRQDKDRDITI